jgi:hypothetical protein
VLGYGREYFESCASPLRSCPNPSKENPVRISLLERCVSNSQKHNTQSLTAPTLAEMLKKEPRQ